MHEDGPSVCELLRRGAAARALPERDHLQGLRVLPQRLAARAAPAAPKRHRAPRPDSASSARGARIQTEPTAPGRTTADGRRTSPGRRRAAGGLELRSGRLGLARAASAAEARVRREREAALAAVLHARRLPAALATSRADASQNAPPCSEPARRAPPGVTAAPRDRYGRTVRRSGSTGPWPGSPRPEEVELRAARCELWACRPCGRAAACLAGVGAAPAVGKCRIVSLIGAIRRGGVGSGSGSSSATTGSGSGSDLGHDRLRLGLSDQLARAPPRQQPARAPPRHNRLGLHGVGSARPRRRPPARSTIGSGSATWYAVSSSHATTRSIGRIGSGSSATIGSGSGSSSATTGSGSGHTSATIGSGSGSSSATTGSGSGDLRHHRLRLGSSASRAPVPATPRPPPAPALARRSATTGSGSGHASATIGSGSSRRRPGAARARARLRPPRAPARSQRRGPRPRAMARRAWPLVAIATSGGRSDMGHGSIRAGDRSRPGQAGARRRRVEPRRSMRRGARPGHRSPGSGRSCGTVRRRRSSS